MGHSMGAKTAMTLALSEPRLVRDLISVDNAPVDAALKSDFATYVRGMREVAERGVGRQSEADEILKPYVDELGVRQFLLTNLVRDDERTARDGKVRMKWRVPIKILADSLGYLGDFPFTDPEKVRFEKPSLFVRGTRSHYVPDETLPIIGRFFPRFEVVDVDSGHWVISENPEAFRVAVVEFLERVSKEEGEED
jgi:pimeloyl-ACP methyl ester carboxylesterase